ncbi:hypothetical protein NG798_26035, partial [Ancylothrix sp. C2]|uniref:chemotaxis protein CheB n=1 Tax=Ancylothrix sp. D3o TaxID=2953691 RepID=UPI0021BB4777
KSLKLCKNVWILLLKIVLTYARNAIIFVNHLYFKLSEDKAAICKKIQNEWLGANVSFVDQIGHYSINTNTLYILPDPSSVEEHEFMYADCLEQNGQVMLQVLQPQSWLKKLDQWWEQNESDAGNNERLYMPCIDKIMMELADVKTKIKDLTIAGLILCGCDGDGAYGLKAIKNQGGETAVQNPKECKHDKRESSSMPNTALDIDKEPKHKTILIEGNSDIISLTQWLKSIC